jgi:hypothetical protein
LGDDDWLTGLWRMHAGQVRSPADLSGVLRQPAAPVRVAIPPDATGGDAAAELLRAEREVFVPLRAAMAAGLLSAAAIRIGGWLMELDAGARRRFWRRARPLDEVLG